MNNQGLRNIVLAGGGTGGHLFPGIAVAEELQKQKQADSIVFVGTNRGLEATVVPREGFLLEYVRSEGFVGKSFLSKLRALFYLLLAFVDSYRIIQKYHPDIIIGSGGYASFATVVIGFFLMVPTLILEQNSVPGLTNRILSRVAKAICITYQESLRYFPKSRTFLTGNPVREKILKGSRISALKLFALHHDKFTVLVFGGSHGASSINKAMVDALQYLLDIKPDVQILHQTGDKDYDFVRKAYRSFGFSGMVTPFIVQMAEAYAVSNIVISRAGATTLAEITALGKPTILIPYPFAAADHQERNARKMEQMQAAFLILDRNLNGRKLADMIKELYQNEELRNGMAQKCRTLGQPNAAKKVVEIASSIMSGAKRKNV